MLAVAAVLLLIGIGAGLIRVRREIIEVKGLVMATQADVDALAQRVSDGVANIRQDIADVKAANPGVDLGNLEASVAALEALDAENPAAAPEEPVE